jgi:choline dehydrogenase
VRRILIEDGRALGVEFVDADDPTGSVTEVRASMVVLSAGVFQSPQLLLRSGIGLPDDLVAAGITPVHPLAGVGSGLLDHGKVEIAFRFAATDEDRATADHPDLGDGLKLHLRLRSRLAGDDPDLDLGLRHPAGTGTMVLTVRLLEQRSAGSVRLDPSDPDALPKVRSGILIHPDDVTALVDGVRQGIALMQHPLLAGRYTLEDGTPTADAELRQQLTRTYGSYNHGIGTCRMGTDGSAVVGSDLHVHGLERLMVADASILPVLPHANTNYAAALVGEWAAARLVAAGVRGDGVSAD